MAQLAVPVGPVAAALGLALVHALSPLLERLPVDPERGLSATAGVAVAYVFVEAFPALARLAGDGPLGTALAERIYVVSLAGFALYFWFEGVVGGSDGRHAKPDLGPFAVHLGAFALYNLLVGYLLVYPSVLGHGLVLFALVMALHVLGTDYDLIQHHSRRFERYGRWLLVAALVVGTATGLLIEFHTRIPSLAYAFLAGGIVLNVVKGELPGAGQARYPAFLGGTVLAAAVMSLL